MDKKRITVIAVTGALILAVVVFLIIALNSRRDDTPAVLLPAETPSQSTEPGAGTGGDNELGNVEVSVTRNTVQEVVAEMARPEAYYAALTVTTYWGSGSNTATAELWQSGTRSRVRAVQADGSIRNVLTAEDTVSIWYEGSDRIYTGPLGEVSVDDELRLYSYEDLLTANKVSITAANYGTYGEASCIYVRLTENSVVTDLWIGTESGLLLYCERYAGGELVYTMVLTALTVGPVDETVFTPAG